MVPFITVLKALATLLITNAHYTGVYPTDLIANGGLLGDVLFFAVSGYCLYNIKTNFIKWYLKRIIRIFPALIIITTLYMLLGCYTLEEHNLLWWYIYPTYYHFVASIMVLYVLYYIIIKNEKIRGKDGKNIPFIILISIMIQLLIYLFFYDKSFYHIDTVREPMIRFLFFDSMMIGAYFRNVKGNKNTILSYILLIGTVVLYFASKLLFVKIESISYLQILNQYILIVLLFLKFKCFNNLNEKISKMSKSIMKVFTFLSELTLEIYLVQYVLIDKLRNISLFPLNWFAITISIILSAYILHFISIKIQNVILKEGKK